MLVPSVGWEAGGGGNGNPLQYSCLENPMNRGASRVTVHGVLNSRTQLKPLSMHACQLVLPTKTEHKPRHCDELFSSSLCSLFYAG